MMYEREPIMSMNAVVGRIIRPIFFLFLTFILIGCGETPDDVTGRDNILRFDVAAPFTTLNPADVQVSGSSVIFPLLYSYLFVPDENGVLQPDLARTWVYDPDTLTWTISLRTDAKFHNGMPVTSKDVKYSLRTVLRDIRPSLFEAVDAILRVSDRTLELKLKWDDPDFCQKIWDMEILCPLEKREAGSEIPVGSGPFRFSSRDGDRKVVLLANPSYYGGRPSLDGIIYYYEPDKEKTWARLLAGKTDIAQEISPKNYDIIRNYEDKFYFDHYILKFYSILLYNTRIPLFSSAGVRRALTRAVDRRYIVEHLLHGYGRVAAGPMGVDSPFHNPRVTPLPYDPQKSLALLEAEGWALDETGRWLLKNGKRFEFTLLLPEEYQVEKAVAGYIKLSFAEIGIRMRIRAVRLKDIYSNYKHSQAILTELPAIYKNSEHFIELWSLDANPDSIAGYFSDIEVADLIFRNFKKKTSIRLKKNLIEFDAIFAELQPGTFLFHKTAFDIMSRRFVLPFPFSLNHEGIFRLQHCSLAK